MYFDRDSYQKSVRRAREERWRVRGRARVVHPKYGAHRTQPAASTVFLLDFLGFILPDLHRHTDYIIALLFQQHRCHR